MKPNIGKIIRGVWTTLVLTAVVVFLATNFSSFAEQLKRISFGQMFLAISLLVAGKLVLVELSRKSVGARPNYDFFRMFSINAFSQLAKYLPGGIWQFVGRAGYYRNDGLAARDITRAMILENVWLAGSALFFGIGALAFKEPQNTLLILCGVFSAWLVFLCILFKVYAGGFQWVQAFKLIFLQTIAWTLLGLSFMATASIEIDNLPLALGAFALSWVVGFVAIFAPGGLGVREIALVTLLSAATTTDAALVAASVNRLVWVVTELILGLIAWIIETSKSQMTQTFTPEVSPDKDHNG